MIKFLQGGNAQFIAALHQRLPEGSVKLNATVKRIKKLESGLSTTVIINDKPVI